MTELKITGLNHYLEIREQINDQLDILKSAYAKLDILFRSALQHPGSLTERCLRKDFDKQQLKAEIDNEFWMELLRNSNVLEFMPEIKAKKLKYGEEKISQPFDSKFVQAFIDGLKYTYQDNFRELVKLTYKALIGIRYAGTNWNDRKVNNLQKIESSFRMYSFCEKGYGSTRYAAYGRISPELSDLFRIFCILDNKPVPPNGFKTIVQEQLRLNQDFIDTDYFKVTIYQKNMKIDIKRLDLLQQLNMIGGDINPDLPDSMKKRYKPEHFEAK